MAKKYNPIYDPNFIGYCIKTKDSKSDVIPNNVENADFYYLKILENLPGDMLVEAKDKGLLNKPDVDSRKFSSWSKKVNSFITKYGIKWIHVTDTEYSDQRGECFYVSLPEEAAIYVFDESLERDFDGNIYIFATKGEYKTEVGLYPYSESMLDRQIDDDDFEEDIFDSLMDEEEGMQKDEDLEGFFS